MANKGPLTSEERLEIVEALRRGNLSHRALAQQFNRSQSTISAIAKDAGISSSHRRKRTPAARDLESTYSREERIRFEDRILGVLDEMVAAGGLSPREVREVAQAAKVALDARRSEDGDRLGDEKAEKSNQTFVKSGHPHHSNPVNLEEVFRKLDAMAEQERQEQERLEQERQEQERLEQQRHQESDE
jgi:Helix-turn-helix domain